MRCHWVMNNCHCLRSAIASRNIGTLLGDQTADEGSHILSPLQAGKHQKGMQEKPTYSSWVRLILALTGLHMRERVRKRTARVGHPSAGDGNTHISTTTLLRRWCSSVLLRRRASWRRATWVTAWSAAGCLKFGCCCARKTSAIALGCWVRADTHGGVSSEDGGALTKTHCRRLWGVFVCVLCVSGIEELRAQVN